MPPDATHDDEVVGSDFLTDKLTEPSQKVTYQDLWNAAYRGLVPGGLNRQGDSSAPVLPDGGDDAEPFSETPVTVVQPEEVKRPDALPVVIFDDLSRVAGSVERYFHTYTINIGQVGTTKIVQRDSRRTKAIIQLDPNDVGDGTLYIGDTESTGVTGFPLVNVTALVLKTTREVWAIWVPAAAQATGNAVIVVEYEKEI
jgi:hypothetical protein